MVAVCSRMTGHLSPEVPPSVHSLWLEHFLGFGKGRERDRCMVIGMALASYTSLSLHLLGSPWWMCSWPDPYFSFLVWSTGISGERALHGA